MGAGRAPIWVRAPKKRTGVLMLCDRDLAFAISHLRALRRGWWLLPSPVDSAFSYLFVELIYFCPSLYLQLDSSYLSSHLDSSKPMSALVPFQTFSTQQTRWYLKDSDKTA